jgi:hypothetical protein
VKFNTGSPFVFLLLMVLISCEDPASTKRTDGVFSGEIKSAATSQSIYPVYIFEGDSLLCIVDQNSHYSIGLNEGDHEIIFSAIGYLDEVVSLSINGDQSREILLTENAETGRVYGEFQDLLLLQQKICENHDMANWTEQQIRDGVTGATIQEGNSDQDFQHAQLYVGDSLFGYADVYGQYWIRIQWGTYPLTGQSEGFSPETKTVKVQPDSSIYMNFYLTPE